jgi:RNA recognition motif-containing protein
MSSEKLVRGNRAVAKGRCVDRNRWSRESNFLGIIISRMKALVEDFAPTTVVLLNVPFDMTQNEVAALFPEPDQIIRIFVPLGRNGRIKGFAYCSYRDSEACFRTIEKLNRRNVQGRNLTCRWANPILMMSNIEEMEHRQWARGDGHRGFSPFPDRRLPGPYREPFLDDRGYRPYPPPPAPFYRPSVFDSLSTPDLERLASLVIGFDQPRVGLDLSHFSTAEIRRILESPRGPDQDPVRRLLASLM